MENKVKHRSYLFIILLVVPFIFITTACFVFEKSNGGVAQTSESTTVSAQDEISSTVADAELTDEQRTTQYVECLRDLGYSMKDPELKADGTIDSMAFRMAIGQALSLSDTNREDRKSFDFCSPLLEGITWKTRSEPEDETKLKDDMLTFAQCLRDKGFNVKDPVFDSENLRASMRPMIQNLTGPTAKVDSSVEECNSLVFDTTESGSGR